MAVATATKKTSNGKPGPKHNIEAMRQAFYDRIARKDMAPLWKVMKSVVTKEPVTRVAPHVWHFDDVKSLVMESGGLISAEEAERRVLILENPALGFLGANQAAGFHDQRFDVVEVPDMGHAPGHRFIGDDVLHHLPQRRHVLLADAVGERLPHGLDIVFRVVGVGLSRGSNRHGILHRNRSW